MGPYSSKSFPFTSTCAILAPRVPITMLQRTSLAFVSLSCLAASLTLGLACGSAAGDPNLARGGSSGSSGAGGAGGAGGSFVNPGGSGSQNSGGSSGSPYDGSVGANGGVSGGCASDSYAGEVVPLDMYMMLDKSGSMGDSTSGPETSWTQVTKAIKDFVALPGTAGLAMGIGFFPLPPSVSPPVNCGSAADCFPYDTECLPGFNKCPSGFPPATDSCLPVDYRNPAVTIQPLPGVAGAIASAIDATDPVGSTPMAPALWGSMQYAQPWAQNHPDHVTIVVLATDGMPTSCVNNDVPNVAAIAEGALTQNNIRTFVIGIGSSLDDLNQIAQKGGTDKAIMVQNTNAGQEFFAALSAIRGSVSCVYKIPVPEAGTPNPKLVNVAFTPDGGAQEVLPQVASAADCGTEKAWYYDDPQAPQHIMLCPAACDMAQNVKGKIDVVIGCQTVVR